jgi:hypothetical protein
MLVKTTLIEHKKVERNIELPYYSKNGIGEFFRINENESVLKVSLSENYSYTMGLYLKSQYSDAYGLDQAIAAQQCEPEEVEQAVRQYLASVGETIEQLSATA